MTNSQEICLENFLGNQSGLLLAETGSGKTLCYLIPILNRIFNEK